MGTKKAGEDLASQVLDNLLEGCQVIGPDFRYQYVNEAVAKHGRTTRAQLLGRTMTEVYPGIEETAMFEVLRRCMKQREAAHMENEFAFPDGTTGWFELRFEPFRDGVVVLSLDITDRKRAEHALQRSTRALAVLSDTNQTLVRAEDEDTFARDVCRIAVERGGYLLAWVGLGDAGEKVKPVAHAGRVDVGDGECAPDLVTRAMRADHTLVDRHRFGSSIALPVRIEGRCAGGLAIFAREMDAFDAEESRLLEEMALDLGHGLATLRSQSARRNAETRYHELVSNLEDVVFSVDVQGRIEYLSPAVTRIYGYDPDEVLGGHFSQLVHPDDLAGLQASFERTLAGSTEPFEFRGFTKGGAIRHLRSKSRLRINGGCPVGVDGVIVDLTELRREEQARQEVQREHATLLGNLPGMAYRCGRDRDWTMEIISGGCMELTGYSPQDLVQNATLHYAELVHPEDRERVRDEIDAAVSAGENFVVEYRIKCARGEIRWVWEKGTPVFSASGQVTKLEGFIADITSRKQAEAQAKELNDRLLRLAQVVQALSGVRSMDRITELVRTAARDLVGADGATFVLRDGEDCSYIDEDAIAPLWKGKKFPLGACVSGWVMLHRCPAVIPDIYADDRIPHDAYRPTFVQSLAMVPIRSDDPVGAIGAYWARRYQASPDEVRILRALADSTAVAIENIRFLSQLEEGEARVRAIYDHLPNPTFIWRRRGDGFVMVDLNVAAGGQGRTSLVGSKPEDLEDCFPDLVEDLSSCMDTQRPVRREVDGALPGSDAPRRLVLTYGFIPQDMVIQHTEDVTEKRQTEQQLQASQRLEAIGRLAGGVAHDFNNLLTVINSYTAFVIDELSEEDPLRADLTEVRNAGERGAALTRQLLAFGRRQILEPVILDLNKVVLDLERMLRRLLGEDIDIAVALAEGLGRVEADPGQLEQVIMNLAVNARDAMPTGGKLTIETANADLDDAYTEKRISVRPGRFVRLSVSDTGCGMDGETQTRLFEPFFTTKDKGKGTGLGLATVYGIVKQSGGHIWVYSEVGRGTTFKVYLPRVEAEVPRIRHHAQSIMPRGNERVMIVEDEDGVRRLAERMLISAGYRVTSAASPGEALRTCNERPYEFDLLVTDVVMPEMSGRELAERMRETVPNLKVLYMSGYTDNAIVHHGVLDRDARFIAKPFTANSLTKKVRQVLDE